MALIKIYSLNGIELVYKSDSLTLKKENNSFSQNFKVSHSVYPFLIFDNENCKSILGSSDITSVQKNKIVPVIILENGVKYYGEIQQLSVLSNFRKVNLKYGSELLKIVNRKISEFMPVFSVLNEEDPIPYVEESAEEYSSQIAWSSYPLDFLGKIYPEVKFQFPTLEWKHKFGEKLDADDPWYDYKGKINGYLFLDEENKLKPTQLNFNSYTYTDDPLEFSVINRTVIAPQVFLLAILEAFMSNIGFKVSGSFAEHSLIKRLLVLNTENHNLTKHYPGAGANAIDPFPSPIGSEGGIYFTAKYIPITAEGKYAVYYDFTIPNFTTSYGENNYKALTIGKLNWGEDPSLWEYETVFNHKANSGDGHYKGVFYVDITGDFTDWELFIEFLSVEPILPVYTLSMEICSLKEWYQAHPTIELGRFVPDWSVGNYLNYIKNFFNLEIALDDFKKEIKLNFNEGIVDNEKPFVVDQSLKLESYDLAAYTSFVLKYENDEDEALFITKEEIIPFPATTDDFTKEIETKFKFVPHNGITSVLSDALHDREGVGLMIYEPSGINNTSAKTSNGLHLNLGGEKGIHDTFFKRWMKFLLNGSICQITGYFTETEVNKISNLKSIYVNNQRFRIIDFESSEAPGNFIQLKMNLISVNL